MDALSAVAALHDTVRRALYDYVVAQGREVSRNEAAEAVGVQRTLAAFHLDKLVEAGLLEAGFKRLNERTGPGSGRPAKVYRRAAGEVAVAVPPRDYRTLALVLAEVVDAVGAEEQAEAAARRVGERLARQAVGADTTGAAAEADAQDAAGPADGAGHGPDGERGIAEVLRERGYEPYRDGEVLRLRNCPFHLLSEEHPLLVCSMNLALCQGLLRGLGEPEIEARADPRPGECCVSFAPSKNKNY